MQRSEGGFVKLVLSCKEGIELRLPGLSLQAEPLAR